jgi:hypothetical protein
MSTQTQITIMDCMDRKLRYFYIQHDGYINGSTHTIIEKLNRESKNLNFKNTDELVN